VELKIRRAAAPGARSRLLGNKAQPYMGIGNLSRDSTVASNVRFDPIAQFLRNHLTMVGIQKKWSRVFC